MYQGKLSVLTQLMIIAIFLASLFIFLDTKSLYIFLVMLTSWFADIVTIVYLLLQGKGDSIFNHDLILSYSFFTTLVKAILGIANLYLLFLHSFYKNWWGIAGTTLGGLVWLIVGYIGYMILAV